MTVHRCIWTDCLNVAVHGMPECLEHTEPDWCALPVLPAPFTTEPPEALAGLLTDAELKAFGDALIAMVPATITAPTASETLELADELAATGHPDDVYVAEQLRAVVQTVPDRPYRTATPAPPYLKPALDATAAEMSAKIRDLSDRMGPPPEPIKLTRQQMISIPTPPARLPGEPDPSYFGVPVEEVDTVEESTPYLMAALDTPPADVEEFTAAFERAHRGAMASYLEPPTSHTVRVKDHPDAVVTFEPVPTVGFYEPPQPGWLARSLARIFR